MAPIDTETRNWIHGYIDEIIKNPELEKVYNFYLDKFGIKPSVENNITFIYGNIFKGIIDINNKNQNKFSKDDWEDVCSIMKIRRKDIEEAYMSTRIEP
jgi:hypothetical protein